MSRPSLALAAAVAIALIAVYAMRGPGGSEHDLPGNFDYYALVLGWAPTYCNSQGRLRKDAECNGQVPRAFVLHGLWPQYQKGWPENCHTASNPWVPGEVIGEMRDIMPSKNLVIHEYRTHGTCSGLDPEHYFSRGAPTLRAHHRPAAIQGDRHRAPTVGGARSSANSLRPIPGSSPT